MSSQAAAAGSQIFNPYRAIGICSNHVPLVAQSLGSDTFVVTAVGKAFHVYLVGERAKVILKVSNSFYSLQCDKLRLIFVGM